MTTRRVRTGLVAALAAVVSFAGCLHQLAAGPPGIWELRGAIVDATGDRLRVRHKTGEVIDLIIDDRTQVMRNERPESCEALRRGVRVRVVIEPLEGGARRAQVVRLYGGGS